MEFLVELEGEAVGIDLLRVCDQRLEGVLRHGPVEIVALYVAAAQTHQIGALLCGLHAFDDDRHRHGFGHVDHRFQDVHALLLRRLVHAQEISVQLDHVHVQLTQHVQR